MKMYRNIKSIRELKNLTQEFVADQLNVSQSTYCRIENGKIDIGIQRICEIAKIFQINAIDIILFDQNEMFAIKLPDGEIMSARKQNPENENQICSCPQPQYCKPLKNCVNEIMHLRKLIVMKL